MTAEHCDSKDGVETSLDPLNAAGLTTMVLAALSPSCYRRRPKMSTHLIGYLARKWMGAALPRMG